ncbi:MAG: DMT family transporter [Actinomycetales bacterium]
MTSTAVVVVTALASALAAATSSVLQHRSASQATPEQSRSGVRLVLHLLTQPLWLLGTLAALVGLALHVAALDGGRLTLVQPLLVSGLLFALPLSVLLERRRPSLTEWVWALVVIVGLSAFLAVADPRNGSAPAPAPRLAAASAVGLVVMLALWLAGRVRPRAAAVLVAAAGGIGFGVTSALLKQCAALAARGLPQLLASWALWGCLLVGAASIVLTQVAYRSGPLASSLPAMTVGDPAAAVLIGVLAFGEQVTRSGPAVAAQVGAFALMAVGTWQLARRSDAGVGAGLAASEAASARP